MKTITIGRSSRNNIRIFDPDETISRTHAIIKIYQDSRISLTDLSANGTWVNGVRIPKGQETFIFKTDSICFANKFHLDWSKVFETNLHTSLPTNFIRDARLLMGEVASINKLTDIVKKFFGILLGGSSYIITLSKQNTSSHSESLRYYTLFLALGVLMFSNSNIISDLSDTIVAFQFIKNDLFIEVLLSFSVALSTFLLATLNYKLFKTFTNSRKRWQQYFDIYCYNAGTYFGLIAIILTPYLILEFKHAGHIGLLYFKISLTLILISTAWALITWVITNFKFWD